MGHGIRDLGIGPFVSEGGSNRIYQYEQTLIFESQNFEVMPHGDLFYTGSPEGYDNIQKKVNRFIEYHAQELKYHPGKKIFL